MYMRLWIIAVLTLLVWGFIPLSTYAGNMEADYPKAKVNTDSRLNVRSGPGTNYELVGQLNPGDIVEVTDDTSSGDGWVQIRSAAGLKGYVAKTYILMERAEKVKPQHYIGDYWIFVPTIFRWYYSIYLSLLNMDMGLVLVLLVFVLMIEFGIIFWMRSKYDWIKRSPATTAYVMLLIFTVLTIPGIFIYEGVSHHRGIWPVVLYVLMLLSTGCGMLHAAWRIRQCGMYMGKRRREESPHYSIGRWTGNILWLLLLIPFAQIWWEVCDAPAIRINGGFMAMLVTMAVLAGINYVIVKWVWPYGIVRYLFQSANQGIVHIMSFVLIWGVLSYEYKLIDRNFNGLTFLAALFLGVLIAMFTVAYVWSTITECRCSNCHSFNTRQTGFTDLGYEYRTKRSWKDINESSVRRRISGSEVVDARGLVETTEKVSKWQTHHTCYNCMNTWDMDHEATVDSTSRTVRKKWTERY